jgi:hypothetical protein
VHFLFLLANAKKYSLAECQLSKLNIYQPLAYSTATIIIRLVSLLVDSISYLPFFVLKRLSSEMQPGSKGVPVDGRTLFLKFLFSPNS